MRINLCYLTVTVKYAYVVLAEFDAVNVYFVVFAGFTASDPLVATFPML